MRYIPYLTFLLGVLGIVFCMAGLIGIWLLGSRLTRTSEKVFDWIDESAATVQERVVGAQRRVQELKITTEDIDQGLKNWTHKESRNRLASQLEIEEKTKRLVLGLRQADQWLEVSGASIHGIQQALEFGSSLGASVDTTWVDPLLEKLGSVRSQLKQTTEKVDGIRERAAGITAGDSREEQIKQAIQLTLRVVVTLGEVDARLGKSIDKIAEIQSKVKHQKTKTLRRIVTAMVGALLLIAWMGAGQFSLCQHGWRGIQRIQATA